MANEPTYWFPAKRFGWGWGVPTRWQGWAVVSLYIALLGLGGWLFPPERDLASFFVVVMLLTVMLVVTCWIKGEPPEWRWGD
jgi:uncharacterized membrane protein YhaH (DUF805 family)